MRKLFLIIAATLFTVIHSGAQTPEWVTKHPVSDDMYIGIGQAPLSEKDYMRIATENALSDIASQIATKVESKSFFHQVDVDGHAREMFEDRINSNATAWIEGQELKDSYASGSTYYVYYVLDKQTFQRNAEKKRQAAISTGMDYLQKGRAAEDAMNLTQAAVLYGQGLEAIEPWMFMDLTHKSVNIPVELYNSYINVFSGMAITVNTVQIEGESFKAVSEPIAGCLSKNGYVVPNIRLKAEFANEDHTLFPNQFVNARLLVTVLPRAVTVPTAAVQLGSRGSYVYVVDKDTVRLREVTPGVRTDSLTVIDKGLAAGEVVVVDGVDRLRDGLRVRVTASMETPRVTVPATGSEG